ncbi:phage tail assembly chaperone [Paenibacillus alkalitolerans]|uniref:phage tail assembly chaperone n=1 Tax=Paenibacillus alkalitolerans TaxID=2799335 RepID=UPI0018F7906C|nr:hypothetical protein [Paenibacillus alkalitolerans]
MNEKKDDILLHEDALLRGLLEAAEDRNSEVVEIEIARKGKVYFKFRVRPVDEKESNRCNDLATKYERKRGIRIPVDVDTAKYRSLLIHTATVDEDRAKVWDNKKLWEQLNVLSGIDVIEKVLLPGEKEAVIKKINEISGYNENEDDDEDLEALAKN